MVAINGVMASKSWHELSLEFNEMDKIILLFGFLQENMWLGDFSSLFVNFLFLSERIDSSVLSDFFFLVLSDFYQKI